MSVDCYSSCHIHDRYSICLDCTTIDWSTIISLTYMPDPATGRRRNPATHDAILDATSILLEEIGFDKLSLEGVAARAGVGKATIYRWWPNKSALAMEALLREVGPNVAFPETECARQDIEDQIRKLAALYRGKIGRVVCEMIGLSQFDVDTMRLFNENFLDPRRNSTKQVLLRGIENGEFKADLDFDVVFDLLYGPIIQRMLMRHAGIDERHVDLHVALVLDGISPDKTKIEFI